MRRLLLAALLAALSAPAAADSRAPLERRVVERPEGAHDEAVAAVAKSRRERPEAWERKIVFLGFDSCDGDLVEGLIREGKLPNFARLRREGAYGPLESIQPTLSPVVWTTIATGMSPPRHGILDFVTQAGGKQVPVSSRMRTADTIWEIASKFGDTVGVVGWLVTWPAETPLNGFLLSDRMGQLAFDYGRALDTTAPDLTWPAGLAAEVEANDRVTPRQVSWNKVRAFADVSEQEHERTYQPVFNPVNRVNNLRLTLATAETFRGAGQRLLAERRPRFFACYFEAMDALSHLFMRFAPPKMRDVDAAEYMKFRHAIESNYVWHDRVLGEFMELCDDRTTLILVSDHGFKSGDFRRGDASDFHAKTGAMWHRIHGVFHAWGYGVEPGARLAGASVMDVAPTVLAAMGYPVPKEMRGRVLESAFRGGLPHDRVPTYFGEQRREALAERNAQAGPSASTPEDEAALERLKSLGYIGGDRSDPVTSKLNLGQSLMSEGRFDEALAAFEDVLKTDRTPRVLASTGWARHVVGRSADGLALVQEALEKDPADVHARMLRARIYVSLGRHDDALRDAETALSLQADVQHSHAVAGDVRAAASSAAARRGEFERALALRMGAIEAYEDALRLEPNFPDVAITLAALLLERPPGVQQALVDPDATRRALEHLDRALSLRPEHAAAHNSRAIARMRLGIHALSEGRADEGDAFLRDAVAAADDALRTWRTRRKGEYARGWANRAYACWIRGDLAEAATSAAKTREADPTYVFDASFMAAMEKAGRPLPPPEPKPAPKEPPAEPRKEPLK
ncbi:MAG: hypothetical protein HMLKMBBP_02071 [Planctomycetes bacterium]|nr:hypothetical protein [Planctomycetota bacterium]